MGEIRDRMEADLVLRGYSEKTRRNYVWCCRSFVRYHGRPPQELRTEDVRDYLVYLRLERELSTCASKLHLAGIKFLYRHTLKMPEVVADIPWPKTSSPLPEILSGDELEQLFDAAETPLYRAAFMTAYGAGLRVAEVCRLRAGDIDSKRGVIIVRCGKGGKDRLTVLPDRLLRSLRDCWLWCRPKGRVVPGDCVFVGQSEPGHIGERALEGAFRRAVGQVGLRCKVRFHTLRHCFATHCLEDSVDLRTIQEMMGHTTIRTTERYTRVRADHIGRVRHPMDLRVGPEHPVRQQ